MSKFREYLPGERILLFVGNYGSGKTEVSVSLAIRLAKDHRVAVVDLDVVNPYFRCREAREEMESRGIRVINPEGEYRAADLPIILPEIRGAVQAGEEFLIMDVGGDDVGARVLGSLADVFRGRTYAMLQVVNAKRPFTETVEGCVKIKDEIEAAARLEVTGLVSNAHLMEETDRSVILEGLELTRALGSAAGLPVVFVAVGEKLRGEFPPGEDPFGCPVHWLRRRMLPPWNPGSMTDKTERVLKKKT